jgi:hypothetical protein
MKNQYFGDVNDYRKYGLLRGLTDHAGLSLAVCWMLTADDGRTDGRFIDYLRKPLAWRGFDSDLFDYLRETRLFNGVRDVSAIERDAVLGGSCFFSDSLSDNVAERSAYFDSLLEVAKGRDLIFFDPDNGVEVRSIPCGSKDSSKYVFWDEIQRFHRLGFSLLVYQHFPRVKRDRFIEEKTREMRSCTGTPGVYPIRTSNVVFFLLPRDEHCGLLGRAVEAVTGQWKGQIGLHPERE